MTERDFKGVWIPKDIWLNSDLSAVDKIIYTEISSLDNEEHCSASNEYLSNFCGVSVPTVTRSIKKLKDLDLIEELTSDGRRRILKAKIKEAMPIKLITQANHDANQIDYDANQNDYSDQSNWLAINIINNKDINNNKYISKDMSETDVSVNSKKKPTSGIGSNGFRWSF